MKIKHVLQPTDGSCGQACLAMLTGHPISKVFKNVPDRGSTHISQLIVYLLLSGWKCFPFLQSALTSKLPDLAIINLRWHDREIGHWVIWANGRFIDPAPIPAVGAQVESYLQVYAA